MTHDRPVRRSSGTRTRGGSALAERLVAGGRLDAACDCLDRSAAALGQARTTADPCRRYVLAHTAALRVAAAILAARTRPRSTRGLCNAWTLLGSVAPELQEWADYFAAGAAKRQAATVGAQHAVSPREADDLVRAVEQFTEAAERCLGLRTHAGVGAR